MENYEQNMPADRGWYIYTENITHWMLLIIVMSMKLYGHNRHYQYKGKISLRLLEFFKTMFNWYHSICIVSQESNFHLHFIVLLIWMCTEIYSYIYITPPFGSFNRVWLNISNCYGLHDYTCSTEEIKISSFAGEFLKNLEVNFLSTGRDYWIMNNLDIS